MNEAEIARRLEKLERDNRRLKGFAFATIILAAALGAIYATHPVPQVIRAHAFEVIDNSGKVRAKMAVPRSGGAVVGILDAQGHPLALLGESAVGLADAQGHSRATMTVNQSGVSGVSLSDAEGHPRAQMEVDASGGPDITLYGPHLAATAWIAVDPIGGTTISLNAAHGDGHASIAVSPSGAPTIALRDARGYSMDLGSTSAVAPATGEAQQTSAASIVMFGNGKGHHVIWQAP